MIPWVLASWTGQLGRSPCLVCPPVGIHGVMHDAAQGALVGLTEVSLLGNVSTDFHGRKG